MLGRSAYPCLALLATILASRGDEVAQRFHGACDASAASALDARNFVVADDENNILRIYSAAKPGMPLAEFPMGRFLKTNVDKHPEADLEACTRVGDRIYWIASHGRSKKGKWRPNRYLFFATDVVDEGDGKYRLDPCGRPSRALLDVLLGLPRLDLRRSVGKIGANAAGSLAPKEEGLNIEGLAADPEGEVLYVALRNPRPGGRALLLPMLNAAAVVEQGERPRFGRPLRLDLGGRGVRSIEYSPPHGCYFLIGGSHEGERISALYSWDGKEEGAVKILRRFGDLNPEAIALVPGTKRLRVLSDDGTVMYRVLPDESIEPLENGQCECKHLKDPRKKSFRSLEFDAE